MGGRGVRAWDWAAALVGLLLILSLFLTWYSTNKNTQTPTGWQALAWVDKIVLICGLLAIAAPWFARMRQTPADAQRYLVGVVAWALFTLLVLIIRIVNPPKLNDQPIPTAVKAGPWVALVLVVILLVVLALAMRARVARRAASAT